MKKFFITLTMMLLGLFAGVSTVWAVDPNPETDYYWAKLTARPSTGTGGSGKVYVSNTSTTPADGDYQNESSAYSSKDSYVQIDGNVVDFYTYAKADDGSYFVGWSDFNGGTEKGQRVYCRYEPSAKRGISNALEYAIYATFEPIRIVSYSITGDGTTYNKNCSFTVSFQLDGADVQLDDFKEPDVTCKEGTTGTWVPLTSGRPQWGVGGNELKVPVKFTAGNDDSGEFAAILTVTTKAGISIDVPLYARTITAAPGTAALYDGKTQKASDTVAGMLAVNTSAYEKPVLKLLGDCSEAITIAKNLTLDLNGFALNNNLTVSGGNVTIAYSPFGGTISSNVSVTGGKLILTGGTITGNVNVSAGAILEQNGAAITGDVTNAGTLTTTDGSITGQLTSSGALTLNGGTFTNNRGAAIAITGGTAQIKRGTISGSTYGVQTSGGTTTIEKLAVITGGTKALHGNGGTLTVNNGKFTDPANLIAGTVTFKAGYFQTHSAGTATALDKQVWRNRAGVEYREGYKFFVGDQAAAQASNVSVCRINTTAYPSLEDALAYANNNPSKSVTIFMENDYTLPAGYYTLPANATLVVPMSDDQNIAYPYITHRSESAYPTPYVFRTLTFASGVNMSVLGTIELSGEQFSKGGDPEQSIPGGPYGRLILKPGSHVTLNDGGELRAWGYVTGDGTRAADGTYLSGEIDARRGSSVREQFQIGDWKGGDISFTMIQDEYPQQKMHLFPIYEYFIQNVESPVKYHPGSALYCSTAVDAQVLAYANDIKVVGKMGEPAMFLMDEMADAENTWVRKWYDANKDRQVYEINSGAQLGSMVINLGEVPKTLIDPGQPGNYNIVMDSRKYILPLTSNMKIHLLSGYMQFTQSTACLPGMEVEIDKESTISLINQNRADVVEGALYLYDSDQWGTYVHNGKDGKYGTRVHYSATLNGQPTARNISSADAIGDAILNVHGTFQVDSACAVYTTVGKTKKTVDGKDKYSQDPTKGGASIISTNEDAGTFIFNAKAPVSGGVTIRDGMFEWNAQGELNPEVLVNYDNSTNGLIINPTARGNSANIYGFELCTSALLKNGDGSFTQTEGTEGGNSFCFIDGRWTDMKVDEDNYCFMVDGHEIFYAKPAEYVAISATKDPSTHAITGNADHTFSDYDGTGRLFILMEADCQWWEVEKKDNLYHCIHPDNDTYYYWDDDNKEWKEQRFTITWKNWDGTEIKSYIQDGSELIEVSYSVTYGTQAEFLGSNPTREPNIDYTYDFTGWTPALGKVTSDVTYTATYSKQPRKYTIIFTTEGGVEIERQFLTHNELPVCENVPTKTGFTLQWEPALAAVTGDATYRATWLEEPPTKYKITFVDYNGTTVLKDDSVAVGTMPTPPADPAGKPATAEFTYVFQHWSPSPEKVSATSIKSYTAVYKEVAKTYEIKYYKEDGTTLISSENLTYGATPTPPAVTKEDPEEGHTYTLVWKTLNEAGTIQTVQGEASYKPTYLDVVNRYTVTLRSNIPGACTLTGAGTYDYNTMVSISATPAEGYEFVRWQETSSTSASLDPQALTADITLTAELRMASLPDLPVGIDAEVTVDTPTDYNDVTITSNGISQSGQIINANNIILHGNADFVLQKPMERLHWYDVAVPWRVDATNGIFLDGSATPAVLGSDIALYYYDGSVRATQGKVDACWIPVKDQSQKVLEPGRAYLFILYNTAVNQVTFRKQDGASLLTTVTSVAQYDQTTGYPADAGWNGIANPSLFKAYLNAGTTVAQTINAAGDGYEAISADSYLVVGQPIYVQVAASKSPVEANHNSYAAPVRRMNASADPARYQLTITAEGANRHADRLFVQLDEEKEENTYVIGKDLAKFGTSTSSAQMWIDRYDAKLCLNTVAPQGDATSFPMTLSAPKAGEYTIAIEREVSTDAYELYLTYDGTAIWNLSESAYTTNLNQGTDARYGLRIVARTPQICTGVDEAVVDAQGATRKVLVNEKVFIIRGNEVYTIDGQLVK
ncbi:MAG: hypothetical protein PUC34_01110 [Paludibacteraceae bacterium]|nr:hypothetical protein [Paludibacteraceae bacterium]